MRGGAGTRSDDALMGLYEVSVVRLHIGNHFTGNGFIVYSKGGTKLIITCQHVVSDLAVNATVPIYFSESCGAKAKARILFTDVARDLALLRVDGVHRPCQIVNFLDEPTKLGDKLVLLAFFDMNGATVVRPGTFPGQIMEESNIIAPEPNLFEMVHGNYTSKPGNSGAPVFAVPRNRAVGVHCQAELGIKGAVSVRTIRAVLQGWCPPDTPDNATIMDMLTQIAG